MMKAALITGASGGLGEAFVHRLVHEPDIDCLWLVGRNANRLADLAAKTKKPCHCFAGDLSEKASREALFAAFDASGDQLRMLINCAGYGIIGPVREVPVDDISGMVELNCTALADLCRRALPRMDKGAMIVNVASVAAYLPQTYFSVYAASKAFVLRFSEALAEEEAPRGIHVLALCPQPMATGFFNRAGDMRGDGFKNMAFEDPQRVADMALRRVHAGKRHSLTHPTAYLMAVAARLLPHRLVTRFERHFF